MKKFSNFEPIGHVNFLDPEEKRVKAWNKIKSKRVCHIQLLKQQELFQHFDLKRYIVSSMYHK